MINYLTRVFYPNEIVIKKGAIQRLQFLEGDSVAILCGSSSLERNGHLGKIKKLIEKTKMKIEIINGIQGDPCLEHLQTITNSIHQIKPSWIIACGGGSVIDTAKIISMMYENPEFNFDLSKKQSLPNKKRNKALLCVIPTVCGSGAEISTSAIITCQNEHKKVPIVSPSLLPDLVIVDPSIAAELPENILTQTTLDAFTHALESYCSRLSNPLSNAYSIMAGKLIVENLPQQSREENPLPSIENLLYASMFAGIAQNITSVGAIHAVAHTIGVQYSIAHGLANALVLSQIAKMNAEKSPKPEEFMKTVGFNSIDHCQEWITKRLKDANLPTSLQGLVTINNEEHLGDLIQQITSDLCYKTNPVRLTVEQMKSVLIGA